MEMLVARHERVQRSLDLMARWRNGLALTCRTCRKAWWRGAASVPKFERAGARIIVAHGNKMA